MAVVVGGDSAARPDGRAGGSSRWLTTNRRLGAWIGSFVCDSEEEMHDE